MANGVQTVVSTVADVIALLGFVGLIWGVVASYLFWRAGFRRYKFSRVYFPKDRQDFYTYYVEAVRKAKTGVYITSDGFNMCNPDSRMAAQRMNEAQSEAIGNGAIVVRYQMTDTMHINWLYQMALMREKHGDKYCCYVNPEFERVGHFAVIDPDTRQSIVEFMLPNPGGLSQATTARDYGFIHGHAAKAEVTKSAFEQIAAHGATTLVTPDNYREIARKLFESRLNRHFDTTTDFHIFDEEVLKAIRKCGPSRPAFEDMRFEGWPDHRERAGLEPADSQD
ncbi:MAG: hypothetical protein AB7G40_05650 [Hyphomonadaceae bacterium]